MKKIFSLIIFFILFFTLAHAGQYSGNWQKVDSNKDQCDFIGDAVLIINYKVAKIKVKKWRWDDSLAYKEKLFKGKIKRNNTDISIYSRGIGYKHYLDGKIDNNKIVLTFSSTHSEMNDRFGGCTFEFIKE